MLHLEQTSNEIFNHIDTNSDGLITRSEFNRAVMVQKPLPVAPARIPALATRVENARNYNIRDEIQLLVQSCFEAERKQFDHMISEKVEVLLGQLDGQALRFGATNLEGAFASLRQELQFGATNFEGAFASLRQDFNTLRSDQSGYGEQLQRQVNELHSLRQVMESQMSEASEVQRKNDVSMELHSLTSVRLGKNHEDLCNLLAVEQQQRSREIKELNESVGARITEFLNQESHERASQLEEISRRLEAEHTDQAARVGREQVWQAEVEAANQELVTFLLELKEKHATLQNAFNDFVGEHSEQHEASTNRQDELQLALDSHHERWQCHSENMMDDHNSKITELRGTIQRFESLLAVEKERNSNRHMEVEKVLDTKHTQFVEHLQAQRAAWEAGLHGLRPQVDTALFRLDSIDAEVSAGLEAFRNKMEERMSNLETSFLTRMKQFMNETEVANQQFMKSMKEDTARRNFIVQEIQQVQSSLGEQISQLAANCDSLREECTQKCASVAESVESVHGELVCTISKSQDTANSYVLEVRSEFEKRLQEMHWKVDAIQTQLVGLQDDNQRVIEEGRAEHLRFLDFLESERQTRSQQLEELQSHFSNEMFNTSGRAEVVTMLELERQTSKRLVESETASRMRELEELNAQVKMSLQSEKEERDARHKELIEHFKSEVQDYKQKLGEQNAQYRELMTSHQKLVDAYAELEASHSKVASRIEDVHELHTDNHHKFGSKHHAAMLERTKTIELKYDEKVDGLHSILQRFETQTSQDRDAHEDRHVELKSSVEARLEELHRIVSENRSLWEARFCRLEPRVDTNVFRLDSLRADLDSGMTVLREQVGESESLLSQSFQATLRQTIIDVDAAHQEIRESRQQDVAQWSGKIKELAEKLATTSNNAESSQRMVAELKKEIYASLKELDRSLLARQTESVNTVSQTTNSLFDRLQLDIEQGLRNQDKKVEDFRNAWLTERASLVKTMEEERITVRKAYDEHTRCLHMEHDARVRENREIRADLSKGLADGRRVHQESHDQLQSMLNLEIQRRQELFETERAARTLDMQQLQEKVATGISNLENQERNARNELFERVGNDWSLQLSIRDQKFNEHKTVHNDLMDSHQKLVASHTVLSGEHTELADTHKQGQELQAQMRREFESLLGSERSARRSELKSLDDAHRTELANLEKNVQEVQEVLHLNRAHLESKHDSFGLDVDLRHREINQLIRERFAVWEATFCDVENRVKANTAGLDAIRDEVCKTTSDVNQRFLDAQEMLKQIDARHALTQDGSSKQKEEFSRLFEKSSEMQRQLSQNISEVDAKCDKWRSDFTKDFQSAHSQLDRTVTAQYEASVNNASLQMTKLVLGLKKDHENALHDLQLRIDELRTSLVQERNNHAKWMDEERVAFRKAHDEHVHIVEVERDARVRQIQEVRGDFVKSLKVDAGEEKPRPQLGLCGSMSSTTSGTIAVASNPASMGLVSTGTGTKLGSLLTSLRASRPQ